MQPLLVYLADLTHVGNGVATESFPLNIGLVGSYSKKRFGSDIEVRLFKYPGALQEALKERAPDILGCSNYTWNFNLSYEFCRLAKSMSPDIVTVLGGTNYPFTPHEQEAFLRKMGSTLDVHVFYEGETAFGNLIERILAQGRTGLTSPIAGCQHLHPETGEFLSGEKAQRLKTLDEIPSPYATGLMDTFFDGKLTPLVETARGCPFRCNFCNAGNAYFNNVNLFSDEYVKDELTYIARKASKAGAFHVTFADNNFGMIPRDSKTAELLHSLYQTYQWPKSITVWTGKNSKERVIDVTRLLGERLSISMSVQSMDPNVLKNVSRDNIRLDHYKKISDELNIQGRPQHAEVIMPLPGETLKTHIAGLCELLDTGVSKVISHTLQMLYGTPYKDDPAYRSTHGYLTKFRIVPLDFSQINGKLVFDVEEVAIASKYMTFEEYVQAREFLLTIDISYNCGVFEPLKRYLRSKGIPISKWVQMLFDKRSELSEKPGDVFKGFRAETCSELWESEQDLISHYSRPENYQKLLDYQAGGNVLFKHRVWMLSKCAKEWVRDIFSLTRSLLQDMSASPMTENMRDELQVLEDFVSLSVTDCFSNEGVEMTVYGEFRYDLVKWLAASSSAALSEFRLDHPIRYRFFFPGDMVGILQDAFRRYGTDLAGLVKLIQRTLGLTFIRRVAYNNASSEAAPSKSLAGRHYGPGYAST
jgi:radical SAM superfamily enzyme YgiQ (UPF0313 family)